MDQNENINRALNGDNCELWTRDGEEGLAIACCNVLSHYLPGQTEEHNEKPLCVA